MATKVVKKITGKADCSVCFSRIEWDSVEDIKWMNGNQYVKCPECGNVIRIAAELIEDGYVKEWSDGGGSGGDGFFIVNVAVEGTLPALTKATADKTLAEISAAHNAGKIIIAYLDIDADTVPAPASMILSYSDYMKGIFMGNAFIKVGNKSYGVSFSITGLGVTIDAIEMNAT